MATGYLPLIGDGGKGRISVCVQPFELADGDRTWTVLGPDDRQAGPVEVFLEYHRVTGSSPHTVRAHAEALSRGDGTWSWMAGDWAEADVPALAGFVTWLRVGTPPGGAAGSGGRRAAAAGGIDAGQAAGCGGQLLPLLR